MNPDLQKYELIDRYLNKELSKEELHEFNLKISHDSDFAELVEDVKAANEAIIDEHLLQFKNRMKKDLDGDQGNSLNWKKPILYSGAFLLSLSAGYYFYTANHDRYEKGSVNAIAKKELNSVELTGKTYQTNTIDLKSGEKVKHKTASKSITSSEKESVEPIVDFINLKSNNENPIIPERTEILPAPNFISEIKESPEIISSCNNVKITGIANVIDGCIGKNNGAITIDVNSIKGGKAPYLFSIEESDFTSQIHYTNLKEGIYYIAIKDNNNCISILENPVVVQKKWCHDQIDDAFMPENGETWKFPIIENKDAFIRISSKAGSLVYTAKITSGYPYEWNGRGTNGSDLDPGVYHFILEYENGLIQQGFISIVK